MSAASKNTFFGRERELLQLQRLRSTVKDKSISRFVVVSGRRRVGKTRLILEALPSCDDMPSVYVYINPHLDAGSNLEDFSESLRECLGWSRPRRFHDFEDALMEVFEVAKQRPITLVLDEFQNFGRVEPSFYGTLQKLWDLHHEKMQLRFSLSAAPLQALCVKSSRTVKHRFLPATMLFFTSSRSCPISSKPFSKAIARTSAETTFWRSTPSQVA